MRKPDSVSYELGHWESMTIQRALSDYAEFLQNKNQATFEQRFHVQDLARIFASGTHTIVHKIVHKGDNE